MRLKDAPKRELYPGFSPSALTLGGAPLGGIASLEAHAILRVAAESGITLVDTSSAYGDSESVIGAAPVELSVATKFGNPCGLNGHTHDYSAAHCVQALYASLEALQGKPLACLQLHSPPEAPSPLSDPALVDLLHSLQATGKFGAWGASVHTVNGGMVALAAGAQMLQVPHNLLQQETGALLAMCAVRGVGTLLQSSLCQGWLTEQGVTAARLLLSMPHRLPCKVEAHGAAVDFPALLRRVLQLDTIARAHSCLSLAEMALRFALHAPGASSVLVQVRTAAQLRAIVASDLSPLPAECQQTLVRLSAREGAGGTLVHGAGEHLWHWGVPTPRACIERVARSGVGGGPGRLLEAALGAAADTLEWRRRFVEDGFLYLPQAFAPGIAAELARSATAQERVAGRWHEYETSGGYFRTDVAAAIDPALRPQFAPLEAAMEQLLDASLFGADDVHAQGFLQCGAVTLEPSEDGRVFRQSVVGHRASATPSARPWAPPDGLAPRTFEPIGCRNGWHIDDGFHNPPTFSLGSYLQTPWLIAVVLLTDVDAEGGPTAIWPRSHHMMARLLSLAPRGLTTRAIYAFLSGTSHVYSSLQATHTPSESKHAATTSGSPGASASTSPPIVRATGRAGDVYLLHPMVVHSATISCTGAPRAILNLPLPYGQTKLAQKHGSLCGVTLPILHAVALRHRTPRALLSLLWRVARPTVASPSMHLRPSPTLHSQRGYRRHVQYTMHGCRRARRP